MITEFSEKWFEQPKGIKVLSVKNGELKFNTLADVVNYGESQGIYYDEYADNDKMSRYYLELAELMKREGRNKMAKLCYFESFRFAWACSNEKLSGVKSYDDKITIDPYQVYKQTCEFLVKIKDKAGLKYFKSNEFCEVNLEKYFMEVLKSDKTNY
ncbi:MAG: hypothetical protein R3Y50_09305 [Rikenellaceae bacterium]